MRDQSAHCVPGARSEQPWANECRPITGNAWGYLTPEGVAVGSGGRRAKDCVDKEDGYPLRHTC